MPMDRLISLMMIYLSKYSTSSKVRCLYDWLDKTSQKNIRFTNFQNEKLFKVFAYCLMKASHKEHTIGWTSCSSLEKGQFVFGRKRASEELRLKIHHQRLRKTLENLGTIDIKSDNKFSVITVVNWSIYQTDEEISDNKYDNKSTTNQHQMDNKSTTNQHQINTNKNVKNGENDKMKRMRRMLL